MSSAPHNSAKSTNIILSWLCLISLLLWERILAKSRKPAGARLMVSFDLQFWTHLGPTNRAAPLTRPSGTLSPLGERDGVRGRFTGRAPEGRGRARPSAARLKRDSGRCSAAALRFMALWPHTCRSRLAVGTALVVSGIIDSS